MTEAQDDTAQGYRMRALQGLEILQKAIKACDVPALDLQLSLAAINVAALLSISAAIDDHALAVDDLAGDHQ